MTAPLIDPSYRAYWPFTRRVDIRTGLRVKVFPTVEPVTLALARSHLRLETTGSPPTHPDDSLIETVYLPAAREACEQYLGASLAPQTVELTLSGFPSWSGLTQPRDIELPFGPVLAIDAFTYVAGGVTLGFADYNFDSFGDRVRLLETATWPNTDDVPNAVTVRYEAGYSTPDSSPNPAPLPASIRAAILLTLSQIYDNCQEGTICDISDLPVGVKYLLDPYRRKMGFA